MPSENRQLKSPLDEKFVREFHDRLKSKAEGSAAEYSMVTHTQPKRLFYSAVLSPVDPDRGPTLGSVDYYRPTSCGLDFTAQFGVEEVALSLRIAVFSADYVIDPKPTVACEVLPRVRYTRHFCELNATIDLSEYHHFRQASDVTDKLRELLTSVSTSVAENSHSLRTAHQAELKPVWYDPEDKEPLRSLDDSDKAIQEWSAVVEVSVSKVAGGKRVQVALSNSRNENREAPLIDGNFYAVHLQCDLKKEDDLVPTALDRAPVGDYRYNRVVAASGINCSASVVQASITADFSPQFDQYRYLPLSKFDLSFDRIINNLNDVLTEFSEAMEAYVDNWQPQLKVGSLGIRSDEDLDQAREFLATFVAEQTRIKKAIHIIRTDEDVKHAFLLMTRSFAQLNEIRKRRGDGEIRSWHMFQLGFILSALPDLVDVSRSDLTPAHLLWFPTGGGKTEAVMALAIFEMFRDRLTGRTAGVTAWMRFPLRLLTFQQMQRYLDIVVAAETIRSQNQQKYTLDGKQFRLGYFGGRNNSPNDLRWTPESMRIPSNVIARLKSALQRSPSGFDVLLDTEGRQYFQELKLVNDCPYCGNNSVIGIYGNPETLCLEHRCDRCEAVLPLFIVDEDVYCQLPSILVGTLDKLATIGFKIAFRTIVGRSDGYCVKHGFGVFGRCLKSSYNRCSHDDWTQLKPGQLTRAVSILFQDELHLLSEQLGCFDGHYESLLMAVCGETSGAHPLVIAASATIEGASHQIEHLYRKEVIRFPGEGPKLSESFYAETTPDLQRRFVGIKPFNLAHLNTTMSLATNIFDELSALRNRLPGVISCYGSLDGLDSTTIDRLIDRHSLLVSYVNAKRDGQNIIRSVEEQVRDDLQRAKAETVRGVEFLSGDTEMDEVKDVLRRMKSSRDSLNDAEKLDFVAATSMISHGVDVDRLNNMIFFSFPRTTAEYIQASSRSGRTYPGLVYVVLKASTFRDRSFFRNFVSVHSALDRLVETVPIDRFAVHAVERTLPGVALGALLMLGSEQLRSFGLTLSDLRQLDDLQTLKRLLIGGFELSTVVEPLLASYYQVDDPRASDWKDQISTLLELLSNNIKLSEEIRSIPMGLNNTDTRVMTSLRDVEAPLEILVQNRLGGGEDDSD